MDWADKFAEILSPQAPLGERTALRVGGPAEWLARPRTKEELAGLIKACRTSETEWRVLGEGSNVLVPDDGCKGVTIELTADVFQKVNVQGSKVEAGAGLALAELISRTCELGLSGLEALVGIPGTVGGAVSKNAGGRSGDIGQFVRSVEIVDAEGTLETRERSEIRFGYRTSDLDDGVIVGATLQLVQEDPADLVRRIKKIWIEKKAHQPFGFQDAGYAFRDPRGLSAADLIDKAGLRGTKVGGAELSDRDPRYVISHPGTTSRDVRQLIELVIARVEEQTGVRLELQIDLW